MKSRPSSDSCAGGCVPTTTLDETGFAKIGPTCSRGRAKLSEYALGFQARDLCHLGPADDLAANEWPEGIRAEVERLKTLLAQRFHSVRHLHGLTRGRGKLVD